MLRFFKNNPIAVVFVVLMLAQSLLGGRFANPIEWFMSMLVMLPGIVIGLSFHEFAHAKVSNMLGDDVPRLQGRVTINPAAHIDPIGFVALMFIGFGWGKPVEINPANYKHPRRDELFVAVAGVIMNLFLAFVFVGVLKLLATFAPEFILNSSVGVIVKDIVLSAVSINIVLMIFNLLPIPPLDGFNIVTQVFNLRNTNFYYQVYDKGFAILLLLMLFNVTDRILVPCVNFIYGIIFNIYF